MAKEPGYTQIPHKILEHLMKMHLSPNQWQVLLCIIRKTYGFHKKVDYIANFQIVEATGLGKTVVSRMLHKLNDMQLISRKGKYIGFQEDWGKWKELAEQLTLLDDKSKQNSQQKLAISSPELAVQLTKVSSCAVTQKIKNTITKEIIKDIRLKKKEYLFDNILLTEEEYQKLVERFGEVGTKDRLEALSLYKRSKGKRYKDDYATVLAWERREERQRGEQGGAYRRTPRQIRPRDSYTRPEDY